ncbi:MAG TPA: hypothetical protein VH165_31745 [Kofleriaceae bacterium]|nr:hypothetical protein [Kofleriaceae bacterium]
MKQLIWVILLAVGCHKEGTGAPGPGGQASGASPASATVAQPNGAAPASPAAPTQAAPATGDAIAALDDFDRWLAPIWKLEGAARIQATCRAQHGLVARATTLQHAPAPAHAAADRWQEETTRLATTTGTLDLCCRTRDNSCLSDLHEVFVGLVALASGVPPADRHKDDPAQTDDAPAAQAQPPATAGKALAALQAAAAVLSDALGSNATTPAALCKTGHDAVAAAERMLNAPGLDVPPSIAAEWSALLMNVGAFDSQVCAPGKPAALKDIRNALMDLCDRATQVIEIARKAAQPAKAPTK